MTKDGALPQTDEGAVDSMIVVCDDVDECAQPESYADGEDVVHWSWASSLRAVRGTVLEGRKVGRNGEPNVGESDASCCSGFSHGARAR